MLTEYEAQQVRHSMARELKGDPLAPWKSIVGLLTLIGLVAASSWFDLFRIRSTEIAQAQERTQAWSGPDVGQDREN